MVDWGWRVQSGLAMNIHVLLHVLPNRKWHHRGRLHPSQKKKKKMEGVGGLKGKERDRDQEE